MPRYEKETTPVVYSAVGIKAVSFAREAGKDCIRMHWHDRMEFLRVRRGSMEVGYATQKGTLREGGLMIVPPKTPHWAVAGEEGVYYDVLMFDVRSFYNETAFCQKMLPAIFDGRAELEMLTADPQTVALFDAVHAAEPSLAAVGNVYQLLDRLLTVHLLSLRESVSQSSARRIIDYMEENFATELTSASLAAQFGYTEAHFCRKFKEATGLTPANYIRIYRLERANRLLKEEDLPISEVAARCGFADANYFTRCFKAHFKKTPTKIKQ